MLRYRRNPGVIAVVLLLVTALWAARRDGHEGGETADAGGVSGFPRMRRIVSLAPSITESLYVLGLGDRVVGVTRYCRYPPEVRDKVKIGGLFDPNYEGILGLHPDLVVALNAHEAVRGFLEKHQIPCFVMQHDSIDDILTSMLALGAYCGVRERAGEVVGAMQRRMDTLSKQCAHYPAPAVLLVIHNEHDGERIDHVYVSGENGFYHQLLLRAGARNAYHGQSSEYPMISAEAIIRMNPDVVIEVVPDLEERGMTKGRILQLWRSLPQLQAVRNHRVHVLSGEHLSKPGPRFLDILEDLIRVIHPDAHVSCD